MPQIQAEGSRISVQAPTTTVDVYREVMTGIQTGSYAVLLAIAVVYAMTRKAVGNAWHKHFDMITTLQKVQASNAKSLSLIAESNKRIADLMSDPRTARSAETVETIKSELIAAQVSLETHLESDLHGNT